MILINDLRGNAILLSQNSNTISDAYFCYLLTFLAKYDTIPL